MMPDAKQIDNTIEIVTPENIAFHYRVAGPFRRLSAFLLDFIIRIIFWVVCALVLLFSSLFLSFIGLPSLGGMGIGVAFLLWFSFEWFYGGLFETYWNGQTPGKRMMKIRVLSVDGQPINALQAVLRNVLRVVDMQPVGLSMIGLISCSLNDRFQRLGDLACGTMVVIEERRWMGGVARIAEPEALRLTALIPVDFQPSQGLCHALANYVERRRYIYWARRQEIAAHLSTPFCKRFRFPPQTDPDQMLCALYNRAFLADQAVIEQSPFATQPIGPPRSPFAQIEEPESPIEATQIEEPLELLPLEEETGSLENQK